MKREELAIAQVVSHKLFTLGSWVLSSISPCGICGGQRGTLSDATNIVYYF
jgi:hypothetical protein